MAYDGFMIYNSVEIFNVARTAALAEAIGVDSVWLDPEALSWIPDSFEAIDYDDVTTAPWYDPGFPASGEFVGVIPLSVAGLDDSTLTASTTEYTGDGGRSGRSRNETLPLVVSAAVVASTERGAEYGKRWLDRTLRSGSTGGCSGTGLYYFRYAAFGSPIAHRREVRVTRGTSVTRKRITDCSSTWLLTFTLTADDPYEYGQAEWAVADLGGPSPSGPTVQSSGTVTMTEESCPVYDYTPIYDPLYPALVPSPSAPDFYPSGWGISEGMTFDRFWARVGQQEPSGLNMVPLITLSTSVPARMVRVSIWPGSSETTDQCGPLFSAIVTYLPADIAFTIDGEQKASYVWDGFSPAVRRTDSLVYGPDAEPIEWTAFNDHDGLLVTLDVFSDSDGFEGDGEVRASVDLIPKSD